MLALFPSYALLNIHGTVAHIHAREQLSTAAVFNCWPPSGSSGAAELSVLLKGTGTKVVTSPPRPDMTLVWLLLFDAASCNINIQKYLREGEWAFSTAKNEKPN